MVVAALQLTQRRRKNGYLASGLGNVIGIVFGTVGAASLIRVATSPAV